ncbi:hypothetical protein EJB05_09874, partial [Eragrostis curvula]
MFQTSKYLAKSSCVFSLDIPFGESTSEPIYSDQKPKLLHHKPNSKPKLLHHQQSSRTRAMERATILAALVSLTALFAAGDACDQVPSMSWNDACLKSCSFSQAWTTLCENTLSSASSPATAEVTVFALAAVANAKQMYERTVGTVMNPMLGAGNMPADLRKAVDNCKVKYGQAYNLMASIANQLFFCDFSHARQEFLDAQVAVESCHEGLSAFESLPLYAAVSADYDMTMVTYELGALIVGK